MLLSSVLLLASTASAAANHRPHHPRSGHHRQAMRRGGSSDIDFDDDAPAGGFRVVGDSGVSAQMMFLGTKNTVFILDKTENNKMTMTTNGITHPAWGTSYDLRTNVATAMEVTSNSFCAGGFNLGDGTFGTWGGNQPVTYNGAAVNDKFANPSGANPYNNADGGRAVRVITPCDDGSCGWQEGGDALTMAKKRWYPTIEGLAEGNVMVIGGDENGGYVSTFVQNTPSWEYWPKQESGAIHMDFLNDTVPVNLFPLTWLLPSGKVFLQAAYRTILYDIATRTEHNLVDMPYAQRVYPASGAAVMLPLTPENGYSAELLFCGGSNVDLRNSSDGGAGFDVTKVPADNTCVRIRPDDASPVYTDDDNLPEGRCMGQLIYLPDGKMWMGNGVGMGTAGYGNNNFSIGQSYGQEPLYMPAVYDPNAPAGKRFSRDGLSASGEERMYHSTAILLADGAVLISGSNPNADVTDVQWGTKYSVEKWYPTWYNKKRPKASGFPKSLSYGGDSWNVTFTDKKADPGKVKVVVIRTGFSTHAMNMGQRYLELETSFTQDLETGEITMIVSQMPPNPNVFQPGAAMIFLVVDGIPSMGEMIMIGNGKIGTQPIEAKTSLPDPVVFAAPEPSVDNAANSTEPKASGGVPDIDSAAKKPGSSSAAGLAAPLLTLTAGLMSSLVWM
jgi:hypothetical protein